VNHTFSVRPTTLAELRRARGVTQVQLAARLGWPQNSVSRFERGQDRLVSNLRAYVEALGGTLVIGAAFADDNAYQRLSVDQVRQ